MYSSITKKSYSRIRETSTGSTADIPLQDIHHQESPSHSVDSIRPSFDSIKDLSKNPLRSRTFKLGHPDCSFAPNVIQNQKYNFLSFIPVVLYHQFKFFFNMYFLLVALSQLIKVLQIGYMFTYFGPLLFVLSVTMFKEGYDDYIRYCRDKEANSKLYDRLSEGGVKKVPSSDLKVGDLVFIHKNDTVPADCILLRTVENTGTCFIRTDQLDGETDWKLRIAVNTSQKSVANESLLDEDTSVYAEPPHKDIHSFVGNITWKTKNNHVDPLTTDNMIWMNTVIASDTVLGLVTYTGKDTKAVLNTSSAATKIGLVDLEINQLSKVLALVTLILSLIMVGLDGFKGLWYVYTLRFLILFSYIIPISLRVNLDMSKTMYSYQMMNDSEIKGTIVRTSTIPEELGRIDYLLSDKTGTLTKNEMEMRKIHMGTVSFDSESMEEVSMQLKEAFKEKVSDANFAFKRQQGMSMKVKDVLCALALCHNVTPTTDDHGNVFYQAASPDEVAIVQWTESVGLQLIYRDINTIRIRCLANTLEYEILETFPFTSESKRMGIIVRDVLTNEITFYQKGADSIMSQIVCYNDWLEEECSNMAREGLRTLVIGKKHLSKEHYDEFNRQYHQAKLILHDRSEAIQQVVKTYLENDLELLGLTGVEDKLQDNVKFTLELLRNAGLHIWMLTGDKIETATCIAMSSKLVARNQPIYQITKVSSLENALEKLDQVRTMRDCALVIDGESLQFYLDHASQELISLALTLPVVVCSRCTPTQKADIVSLINSSTNKRTCAVGDGGNDVSMIQAAHVGIGIEGREGRQASLAADFSVTQFSHLSRLLLWHGRNSYQRSAKLAHFIIHRGFIISIMQAVFSALFYFAPIGLYQGFILVGYTTIYTMFPVFSLVFDQDITDDKALLYPELYKELTKGRTLTYKTFFIWILISVYQGGVIMILAIWLFEDEFIRIVSISFTSLIFNELFMVAMEVSTWHIAMVLSLILTGSFYITSMWYLPNYFDITFITSFPFIWKVSVIVSTSILPVFMYKQLMWILHPPGHAKL